MAGTLVALWQRSASAPTGASKEPALAAQLDRLLSRRGLPLPAGLAVRPLAAQPGDKHAQETATAVCDALVARLSRLPGLRVTSCRSTRVALAAELDDAALARVLDVAYVLKGQVASGPEGRMHVQLAMHEVGSARERWRLDRELAPSEVQALPNLVARQTGEALGVASVGPDVRALDPAQYQRYLDASRKARRPSPESRREALAEVEALLREVPDHAPARYMQLALKNRLLMTVDPADAGRSEEELHQRQAALLDEIHQLGQDMLARDPGDWRAHLLLANDAFQRGRLIEAYERVDTLLQHVPQHPGMLRISARAHIQGGYLSRAKELALQAARLDALDAEAYEVLAQVHGMLGDDAAMGEFAAVAEQLGHRQTGLLRLFQALRARDWPRLQEVMTGYVRDDGRDAAWVPAYAQALNDPARREAAAAELDSHPSGLRSQMASYFLEYALLGDVARSLKAIQHHARLAPASWLEHLWWPELAPVRREAGFADAMATLGMTRVWEVRGAPDRCESDKRGGWQCR